MAILPAAACTLRSMNWCVVIELLVWLLICCVLIEVLCRYWTDKKENCHEICLKGRLYTFSTFSAFKKHNSVSLWVKITKKPNGIGRPSWCLARKQSSNFATGCDVINRWIIGTRNNYREHRGKTQCAWAQNLISAQPRISAHLKLAPTLKVQKFNKRPGRLIE